MKKKYLFVTLGLASVLALSGCSLMMTRKTAEVGAATTSVKVAGSFTNWGTNAVEMTLDGGYYTYTRDFAVNDLFKVVVNNSDWISANWNGVGNNTNGKIVDDNSGDHNFKVATAGKYLLKAVSNIGDYGEKGYGLTIEEVAEKQDPSIETNTFYVYDHAGALGTTLANVNVYGFGQADNIKAMDWPGTHNGVTTEVVGLATLYKVQLSVSYPNFIMNAQVGETRNQTANVEDLTDHIGDVLVIQNAEEGYNLSWEEKSTFEDAPAAVGYYIEGSTGTWGYDAAVAMTALPLDDESGNAAKYMGLEATVGTEIRVNSYYLDRYPFKQWANTGNVFAPEEGAIDYGEKSGDNFKFTKAGKYDVYAKYEDGFKFFVAEHVDSYTIEMTAVLFNGATKDTAVTLNSQDAYSNANFEPVIHAREGYVTRGVFTDEACTTAYTPTKFTAAGHLYVKYTKVGYYVISGATSWSIDGGVMMMTEGIGAGNKAEASVTVTAVNETYSFVYYDGEMAGHAGLGEDKDYSKMAVNEESHIKFLKTGTYAVYWSNGDNKIYLNAGNTAFYTTFLSATGGECKTDNTTDVAALQVIWGQQKIAFNALEDAEKAELEAVGFDKGKEDGTLAEQVVARYHYIVTKYGTDAFEDFVWHNEINVSASFINYNSPVAANNAVMIAIVSVIALVSVASIVTVIVIKKKSLH